MIFSAHSVDKPVGGGYEDCAEAESHHDARQRVQWHVERPFLPLLSTPPPKHHADGLTDELYDKPSG